MKIKKIFWSVFLSLAVSFIQAEVVFGEAGDTDDKCYGMMTCYPGDYCVGQNAPWVVESYTGECNGYNPVYPFNPQPPYAGYCAGTKQSDCSGAANYCGTYASPNGCGTCSGTKTASCSFLCWFTFSDTACGADGCGGICYGRITRPQITPCTPVCNNNADYCVGTTYSSGCPASPCQGAKQSDCSDAANHCGTYASPNGCGTCSGTKSSQCPAICSSVCTGVPCGNDGCGGQCTGTKTGGLCSSCTPSCEAGWSQCVNGTQTRTCTRLNCSTYTETKNCGVSPVPTPTPTSCVPYSCEACMGQSCWNGCAWLSGTKNCSTPTSTPVPTLSPCTSHSCEACIGQSCWNGCAWLPGAKNCGGPVSTPIPTPIPTFIPTPVPPCVPTCSCDGQCSSYSCTDCRGTCSGNVPTINGDCGSAVNKAVCEKPTSDLCDSGSATPVSLANNLWSWTCGGVCGGGSAVCTVRKECPWAETNQ